jgi:hypothetical protein
LPVCVYRGPRARDKRDKLRAGGREGKGREDGEGVVDSTSTATAPILVNVNDQ